MSMAQIIEFPRQAQRMSNAYHNLTRLIDAVESEATLEFYIEALVVSHEEGELYPGEAEKLSAQIRQKGRDLAKPEKKMVMVQEVTGPGLYIWCPEMGEGQPECQIRARIGHYGTHYYLDTPLDLKGRGITFMEKHEAKNLTASGQFMAGWNRYKATERAFKKLQEQYSISMESNFD